MYYLLVRRYDCVDVSTSKTDILKCNKYILKVSVPSLIGDWNVIFPTEREAATGKQIGK